MNITKDQIDQSFSNNSEVNYNYETFKGESSENEINRIVDEAKTKGIDVVIGLGGGKALDTGKAVANALNASVIDFASTASMDAPRQPYLLFMMIMVYLVVMNFTPRILIQ